jgi:aldose 1-epimerase
MILPTSVPFGRTNAGEAVELFTLSNGRGLEAEIINYGGIVRALRVPDRRGQIDDVVLGFDALDGYLGKHPYFGGLIGRYGNRISRGRFRLDERELQLACNNGDHHLHGGNRGFDRVVWSAQALATDDTVSVVLRHTSADGDEGYPGALSCKVVYSITAESELRIEYEATSDRPTIINLTHHSYFNLTGERSRDVLGHELTVDADAFLPIDAGLIPTGEVRDVHGTAFDFREPGAIGTRLLGDDIQLSRGRGFDHNFVLRSPLTAVRRSPNSALEKLARRAARLVDPLSGRFMEVRTSEPGLQVYSGGGLDGSLRGKGGAPCLPYGGLCLETQHFPDSPNRPEFPSVRLDPGETYRSLTIYAFSTVP